MEVSAQRVPSGIRYSETLPKGVKSSVSYVPFLPNNGSVFSPGQIVRIPIQATSFLDTAHSYLNITASVSGLGNAADIVFFDAGGHGLIQRLRVLYNNLELERIDDYGHLTHVLSSCQRSIGNYASYGAASEGLTTNGSSITQRNVTGADGGNVKTTTFSLPLHASGILGPSLDKYLPLLAMNQGLVLELTIAPVNYAVFIQSGGATINLSVSNIEFIGALVTPAEQITSSFMNVVRRSGLVLNAKSFRTYVNTVISSTVNTVKIIDALSSIKAMFFTLRSSGENSLLTRAINVAAPGPAGPGKITSSGDHGMTSFFIRADNRTIPIQPVSTAGLLTAANQDSSGTGCGAAFSELLKSVSKLGDSLHGGVLSPSAYTAANSNAYVDTSVSGKAMYGLDLEAWQSEAVLSGLSLAQANQSEILLTLNGVSAQCQCTTFLHFDMEVVIMPDMSVNVSY